ncbi:condensation domain-containing protein [Dyella tabacisoli]|nr:condensation domain-containing protein [Dyella tabacisoli]
MFRAIFYTLAVHKYAENGGSQATVHTNIGVIVNNPPASFPIGRLLSALREKGVTLSLSGADVRFRGPPGCSAMEEVLEARARKEEVREYLRSESAEIVLPLGSYPRSGPVPLSCMQRWWWELEQVSGPTPHPLMVIPVPGQVDLPTLESALTELVRRHEVLRTRFRAAGPEVVVTVEPPESLLLEFIDYSPFSLKQSEAKALEQVEQYRLRTYELDGGSLFRACVIKVANDHHLVLLGIHHIAIDTSSSRLLKRELRALYLAFVAGKPSPLPEPRYQYADFAIWEQHWLRASGADDPYRYWEERLAHMGRLKLPTDFPRGRIREGAPEERHAFTIQADTLSELRELSGLHSMTLSATLLAMYSVLLSRWSGRHDILLGTYTLCRTPPEVADIVGCFASNRPLYSFVSPEIRFADYLEQVRLGYADTLDFRRPISMRLSWDMHLNGVIINHWKSEVEAQEPSTASVSSETPLPIFHDLSLVFLETPTTVHGHASYAGNLFRQERIESFCADFLRLSRMAMQWQPRRLADIMLEL